MPDIAALIEPISEDKPCGKDMSFSPEFDAIMEARRADDPTLEQGDWVKELKVADWEEVESQCVDLLTNKTKDIRVAVWLTEAWARNHGFSGLASAYDLIAQLCATDWDNLHPLPDEDGDEEARINNMSRLLELSAPLMKNQPVTDSQSGRFSVFDLQSARHGARQTRDDEDEAESDNRLAQFESARRDTPKDFYADMVADLDNCREGLDSLEKVLDEKLGAEGPSFGSLRDTLDEIYSLVRGFADDAGVASKGEDKKSAESQSAGAKPAAARGGVSSKITNRAQALAQLRLVSDFFRRTEPHSPVAYLADTAAQWGDMPLHSWLRNVIRDDSELAHVEELLGLANKQRGGGGGGGFDEPAQLEDDDRE